MSSAAPVYLFLGPETGQKQEEIASIARRIAKSAGGAEQHRLYLPDASVSDAITLLQNGSLFSAHRLVILLGVEQIKRKEELAAIAGYCRQPASGATLVLVSDEVRLAAIERAVPAEAKKVFWEMFENQKRGWLQNHFRRLDVSIEEDAIDLFLELVENNTQQLRAEADKLSIYVGKGGTIGVDEVETFIYHGREENVFTLFKHVTEDDFAGALESLHKIRGGDGSPVQLIAGVAFQVRRLLALRTLLDNGVEIEEAFRRLAIRGKRIQSDYRAGAERFSTLDLERRLELLADYDSLFRALRPGIHPCLSELLLYQMMFTTERLVCSATPGDTDDLAPVR